MLDLIKDYIVDVWEGRQGSMTKILASHRPSLRIHLGNWRMLGMVVG